MQFPGYIVSKSQDGVKISRCTFDETELSPGSNWKQAVFNDDHVGKKWGGVNLMDAMEVAKKFLVDTSPKESSVNKSAVFKKTLKSVYGDTVVSKGSLRNFEKASRFECDKGHFWLATPHEVLAGKNCPKCGSRMLSHIAKLFSRRGDAIKLVGEYRNADIKATYECGLCGEQWELLPKNAYDERSVCPSCKGSGKSDV